LGFETLNFSKDYLLFESNKIKFKLEVANIGRGLLGDYKIGDQDWYRRYILSSIANSDAVYRDELDLEFICNPPEIIIEHLSIRENLLNGNANPLQDVKFVGG